MNNSKKRKERDAFLESACTAADLPLVQIKAQKIQQEYAKLQVDSQLKAQELQLEREQNRAVAIGDT